MKSPPHILIDTSFLLPTLGIRVEKRVLKILPLLRRFRVHFLREGLLEAMWIILKRVPPSQLERVEKGLRIIALNYKPLEPPIVAYLEANRLYHKGHRDFIDNLYYATALTSKVPFLTIDYKLVEFLERKGYPTEGVVFTPEDLE